MIQNAPVAVLYEKNIIVDLVSKYSSIIEDKKVTVCNWRKCVDSDECNRHLNVTWRSVKHLKIGTKIGKEMWNTTILKKSRTL